LKVFQGVQKEMLGVKFEMHNLLVAAFISVSFSVGVFLGAIIQAVRT
jgi:hypothetical protein